MGTPDNNHTLSELVDKFRSWIPGRTEHMNVSRDFWMPDQSCRVCYECDSQFTVFNRRHHCRICGRVFCAKCTTNSVLVWVDDSKFGRDDREKIRVCNYCFKHWQRGTTMIENTATASSPGLSPSTSVSSLVSTHSSCTSNSNNSVGSIPYAVGRHQGVSYNSIQNPCDPAQVDTVTVLQGQEMAQENLGSANVGNLFSNQFGYCMDRSDDEDDDYGSYRSHSKDVCQTCINYDVISYEEIDHIYGAHKLHSDGENFESNTQNVAVVPENVESRDVEEKRKFEEKASELSSPNDLEAPPFHVANDTEVAPIDFENNRQLWLPPEPEDEEEEKENLGFDDDDDNDDCQSAGGEWGYLRPSGSFNNGEYRNRDRTSEEHRKVIKNVVEGHFRALVGQLLQVYNLPVVDEDSNESWLEIITSLSWEAATLLRPDTSKGGGMDPGGYVKVKCIACGRCSESMVIKGVVCKKNLAHRRMTSKIDKPRVLILEGALEYQRVSNHLSSFDTLLQQEMDHLKMAVAKIDAHHPNILLVEKSVSRFAQEYLLAKEISLVLNIKRPLLERIARCTGAQIIPSIDHLTTPKLGYCDSFHVEKFFEEHGSAGQAGKKLTKNLMFFEGCPKPLGCTILLKGANGDELKKVKYVVQYGVFAAYHLALETSFLADEGASLPELPLKSPIRVALPDKPSGIDRSISMVPGFSIPCSMKSQEAQINNSQHKPIGLSDVSSSTSNFLSFKSGLSQSILTITPGSQIRNQGSPSTSVDFAPPVAVSSTEEHICYDACTNKVTPEHVFHENSNMSFKELSAPETSKLTINEVCNDSMSILLGDSDKLQGNVGYCDADGQILPNNSSVASGLVSLEHDGGNSHKEVNSLKEEFPPSPLDHQSILVSLSTRCVWKGTVCERAHLFRIKYYGTFDKPLGRFLGDYLFDQNYRCRSCDMPSEAHVFCYTHRQGTLTISVKKHPDFLLPGEHEGKIWMWHRCLRCPRINGFPPATRRIVMSDAAWGLSFGKFLELSFSNHAAASRVASCGHSLHRDCLRFYGFGNMVACFRYAPIDVHSVYLPPLKLEFSNSNQEWVHEEVKEVRSKSDLFFSEVFTALSHIREKLFLDQGNCVLPLNQRITEMERMLQIEKEEFEESLQRALSGGIDIGQPPIDILQINKLRRQLIFHSYVWDRRLVCLTRANNDNIRGGMRCSILPVEEKTSNCSEQTVETNTISKPIKDLMSSVSSLIDSKPTTTLAQRESTGQIDLPDALLKSKDVNWGPNIRKDYEIYDSSTSNLSSNSNTLQSGKRVISEGQFPLLENLSETLDAAWTGEGHSASIKSKEIESACSDSLHIDSAVAVQSFTENSCPVPSMDSKDASELDLYIGSSWLGQGLDGMENCLKWMQLPFLNIYYSLNKNFSSSAQMLHSLSEYTPTYILSFQEFLHQGNARLMVPVGINGTVVAVYDDEPTSIISHALVSHDYHTQLLDESEGPQDVLESSVSLPFLHSVNLLSFHSSDENVSTSVKSSGSTDESVPLVSGSRSSLGSDILSYTKALHPRVSFTDDGPLGKVKYNVTFYYAKQFETLRRACCPSELDFVRSLSRCKKWGAQGGKSNVFFAKTLDDRFIIKQVTKTELESFIKFAPAYFNYIADSVNTKCPTCLAKILGIYQVTFKHLKGGKESKMDVLVMENLLFERNITRLYDLKGSSRSRYNPDSSGNNKVLLDQNLIESMPTSPIFMGTQAKRLLERAIWNDTAFLASIGVMDYSLLVGVDEEKHELVLGIIDFMRQYTWDKHLETWVKASGILGGPKNTTPTVISPMQYKKRFRKAMSTYFLMVPDQWFSSTGVPAGTQSDFRQVNLQVGTSVR